MSKPYLPSRDVEIDEAEWDRAMTLSEAQLDTELEVAERRFDAMLKAMTPLQEYRYWRRYVLTSIMENRRRLRDTKLARIDVIDEMWRNGIKRSQRSLLKHRHHLRTGIWPGSA
jgi:hypothetical protein